MFYIQKSPYSHFILFYDFLWRALFSLSFINKRTKWNCASAIHTLSLFYKSCWFWTSFAKKLNFWLWSFIEGEVWNKTTRKNIQFSISFGLSCLSKQDFFQIITLFRMKLFHVFNLFTFEMVVKIEHCLVLTFV